MSDEGAEGDRYDEVDDDEPVKEWPVKGPATPQQALVAIGFIFFLGIVIGFALARAF